MAREFFHNPQPSFREAYLTKSKDIIANRTIFNREKYDNFVDTGGRGGGKTYDKIEAVVLEASIRRVKVLVTRESQSSIAQSTKSEIEKFIRQRGLDKFFRITKDDIKGKNGSHFFFKGLKTHLIGNLKSVADVDIVVVEEAEGVSKHSWTEFLPSIRPENGQAPIVIVIFNPQNELDDTYQRWIVNTPPRTLVTTVNYYDNIYFPAHLDAQREHAKKTLPLKDYEHIWLGKPIGSEGDVIIDLDWVKAARFASRKDGFEKVGEKRVGYDPAGQGRDSNAAVFRDGNIIREIDEWVKSENLREATKRAFSMAMSNKVDVFSYDECGGFGDGVAVFIDDIINELDKKNDEIAQVNRERARNYQNPLPSIKIPAIIPFNAGKAPANEEDLLFGTAKTNGDEFGNAKAQAQAMTAQLLYNTFRFVVLGEQVESDMMLSIDIEDDAVFNKLAKELTTPLWVRKTKKFVEAKADMEKRTGQASPNIADGVHMTCAPYETKPMGLLDAFL